MKTPKFGRWILSTLLPEAMRDAVIGDLEEGYARTSSPRRWFWRQVLLAVGPALRMQWRSFGAIRIGAAAVASYVVAIACTAMAKMVLSPFVNALGGTVNLALIILAIGTSTAGAVMVLTVQLAPRRALWTFICVLVVLESLSGVMVFHYLPLRYEVALALIGPAAAWLGGTSAMAVLTSSPRRRSRIS